MKTKYFEKSLIAGLLMTSSSAFAIPTLQLDIAGGIYDSTTETIIKSGNTFDVYAYGIQPNGNNATDIKTIQYYLSAALSGPSGPVPLGNVNLGSFTYDLGSGAIAVNVTSGMVFGTPPLEVTLQAFDNGDLSKHGIFPTYFTEITLPKFTAGRQITAYNTQDRAIAGTSIDLTGTGMFYQKVNFDLTNLATGYDLHWDLYSVDVKNGDFDVDDFAPFSHDAESIRDDIPPPPPPPDENVPEPTALWMLGLGLLGLAGFKRKQTKLAA